MEIKKDFFGNEIEVGSQVIVPDRSTKPTQKYASPDFLIH